MAYALVSGKNLLSTVLPKELEGKSVAELKAAGWLPIEDPGPPNFDAATKGLKTDVVIGADKVSVVYSLYDLPSLQATLQQQLDSLTAVLVGKGTITAADVAASKKPK